MLCSINQTSCHNLLPASRSLDVKDVTEERPDIWRTQNCSSSSRQTRRTVSSEAEITSSDGLLQKCTNPLNVQGKWTTTKKDDFSNKLMRLLASSLLKQTGFECWQMYLYKSSRLDLFEIEFPPALHQLLLKFEVHFRKPDEEKDKFKSPVRHWQNWKDGKQ